jgi:4-cresol dehydrogenase (hydroxylating)
MSIREKTDISLVTEQWKEILGVSNVLDHPDALEKYLSDVAEYPQREGVAILHATSVRNVQNILQIDNENLVPVYPISTGRNWGFGSSKPVRDGCAVLNLSGMKHIRELNLERGYAIIEPGVTQRILSEALQGTPYMLNVTGSCSDTSIIGNALERGVGFIRQRTEDILGLEVVLANGDVTRVGGFWSNDITTFHYKHGVGPDIMPMFFQSNFGVVTAAVVSLIPRPESMRLVQAQFRGDRLKVAIDTLARLYQQGLINVVSKAFNSNAMQTYGMNSEGYSGLKGLEFTFYGALMGSSKYVDCVEALVMEELEQASCFYDLRFIDRERWPAEVPDHVAFPFQGVPTCKYIENSFDARCSNVDAEAVTGLFLYAPVLPFDGKSLTIAFRILEQLTRDYELPINASINMIPPTTIDLVLSIAFQRTSEAIERVHYVKEILQLKFQEQSFVPYRVDIEHHDPPNLYDSQTRIDVLAKLKTALDPNNIISPRRYVS